MSSSFSRLCAIFGVLLYQLNLISQNPVFPVEVIPFPLLNPTVYLSDLSDMPFNASKPVYQLTLRDPVEPSREVFFRITIIENGTQVMQTNLNGSALPQFTLRRGIPRIITGGDLAPYFELRNLIGSTGSDNLLKPGYNEICIEIIDAQRLEPISSRRCAKGFWSLLDPPLLALPNNNATISLRELPNQLFTWQLTDPRAGSSGFRNEIRFDFELNELPIGFNPQDAFDNYISIYSELNLTNNFIFYNQLAPLLEEGKTYAWRVRAKRINSFNEILPAFFRNNGYSMVHTFSVNKGNEENPVSTNSPGCDCIGIACLPTIISDKVPTTQVGDKMKIGFFEVYDLNLTNNSGANLSGSGMINLKFLNNLKLKVNFNNLLVNKSNQVYNGVLSLDRNNASNIAVQTINNIFSGIPYFTPNDINWISSKVTESLSEISILPFSIIKYFPNLNATVKENISDLIISDLYFTPEGAFVDLIAVLADGKGGYIRFGANRIAIRPDGLDMGKLFLYLADDISIPGLGDFPLAIKKSINQNPSLGSFIEFDCNGFKHFNLVAEFAFPKDKLVRFEAPLDSAVKAKFILNSSKWGQFIATADIPKFKLYGMPDWSFDVKNAVFDLDDTQNSNGMIFPEFYSGGKGSNWKGFYVSNISVTLPPNFLSGFNSQNISEIEANNLLIDTSGVSGALSAYNILPLPENITDFFFFPGYSFPLF